MEGPQNLKLNPYELPKREQTALIIVVILFHLVGLIGFFIPVLHALFLKLVPWHLLLMLVVIIAGHRPLSGKFISFLGLIFITGFIAEWIGVHKGWLFGGYGYGSTLGVQLSGIPLCISINWFLLIYSAGVLMQRSRVKSVFIRVIIGALILVSLDVLIEPVAIRFDYWHWAGIVAPVKNYICWFLVSAVMLFVFEKFDFKKQSIVAPVFLLVQFVFFIILFLM